MVLRVACADCSVQVGVVGHTGGAELPNLAPKTNHVPEVHELLLSHAIFLPITGLVNDCSCPFEGPADSLEQDPLGCGIHLKCPIDGNGCLIAGRRNLASTHRRQTSRRFQEDELQD